MRVLHPNQYQKRPKRLAPVDGEEPGAESDKAYRLAALTKYYESGPGFEAAFREALAEARTGLHPRWAAAWGGMSVDRFLAEVRRRKIRLPKTLESDLGSLFR